MAYWPVKRNLPLGEMGSKSADSFRFLKTFRIQAAVGEFILFPLKEP